MAEQIGAVAKPREIIMEAVIIRCGCGDPASHPNAVCPRPRAIEDRGIISYYSSNPLKMLAWKIRQAFGL